MDNICDLFPIFGDDLRFINQEMFIEGNDRHNIIMDMEILDDPKIERLDRALFALMKQRGGDPTDPEDGNQWAEAVIGEIPAPMLLQQAQKSVAEEGVDVELTARTIRNGDKENLVFEIGLKNIF
jgi:hypothetical protein